MKRWQTPFKRSPHSLSQREPQPSLDGPEAFTELCVLRETVEDLQCAYEATMEEVLRLRKENRTLKGSIEAAKAKIIELAHQIYGRKSERKRPAPSPTAETEATEAPAVAGERLPEDFLLPDEPRPEPRPRGQQAGTAGHGRRRYTQLPADHEYFEASDEAQRCPRCGSYARKCGIETSTQLDFVVEIRQKVAHRQRYRWICQCGLESIGSDRDEVSEPLALIPPPVSDAISAPETLRGSPEAKASAAIPRAFSTPGPLSAIPRGLFTNQFLVQVLAWKYVWGVPIHRLRQLWQTQGANIAAGSLVGAFEQLVPVFQPWYEALKKVNQTEPWWHADETHWKVFMETLGKVGYRWWLWVFSGPHSTVYLLSPTRSAKIPIDYLQGDLPTDGSLPSWWDKLLITDFFSAYRAMLAGLSHAWCWAHIRRKFLAAGRVPALKSWSQLWIDRIARLYRLHALRESLPPGSIGFSITDRHLRAWVDTMATVWQRELAASDLTEDARMVLATVARQWEGLTLVLDHPELPLDNNEAERLMRTPVIGRKNYYGSREQWSGDLAAMVWTFWATAIQNQREPMTDLLDYLNAYAANGHQPLSEEALAAFLPLKSPPSTVSSDTG